MNRSQQVTKKKGREKKRCGITYSSKITQTLEQLSEVAINFRLLRNLLLAQYQIARNCEQTFRSFCRVCDGFRSDQSRASASYATWLYIVEFHIIELGPGIESLGRQ